MRLGYLTHQIFSPFLQPEKWDSVTRAWRDHIFLFGAVDLLLIDEIHHLGEDRGSALETVIVRMKRLSDLFVGRTEASSSLRSVPNKRFLLLLLAYYVYLSNLITCDRHVLQATSSHHRSQVTAITVTLSQRVYPEKALPALQRHPP